MSLPTTQKQWLIQGTGNGFETLVYQDAPIPKIGENAVLVKLRGASLNYRDLIMPQGKYFFPYHLPVVAGSDGAGEIVSVGSHVTKWKAGDKVVTLFNQGHQSGPVDVAASKTGLGGCIDGTLRHYGAFDQDGLVRMPANIDFVEAATLTCAALTSWNALYGLRRLKRGETVLVQGTGGVSLFALQFAKAAGATVIATTSSTKKAEVLKKLGADHVINYREDPNWGETARKLTPKGEGFEHIIEVGGESTMTQSLHAIKLEGVISLIGVLSGAKPKDNIMEPLFRLCTIRGVYVGSKEQMEEMIETIEKHNIHPVVDEKVFTLETAKEAYEYMWAKKHFGKVGIKIQ
ncbi:putative zinc-type alcohol dehydrogenase-like protein yoga [Corynascus novoguineensis]|uniref:Zinc-type alcohol dehydrogenase-like protein yoga n=1 Tax=Corynascus novoguineensis TaxID=1126955 RepID=A0AAN7CLV1_9PEZI|nr:putative zinc-type alcohol dehydrogenase-like protein yoga [Corynascus novoguineensis]